MTCILLGLIAACGRGSNANRPDDAGLDVPVDACDHGACADAAPGDAPADTPGDASAQISNDVEWSTPLTGLTMGSSVFMCGLLRGENIAGGAGGSISISATFLQTAGLHGTFGFTPACAVVTAFATSFDVACRLGGFSSTTSGALWCDDVTVVPLTFDARQK